VAANDPTSLAVAKQSPQDKLGNFVMIDDRLHVIEYSDFPDDVAERPALWDGDSGSPDPDVVALMCEVRNGSPRITPTHRALQRAFIEIQSTAADEPEREITFPHYLYVLAVAVNQNGYTVAMKNELLKLLADDSRIVREVVDYGMPELESILDASRKLCGMPPIPWDDVRSRLRVTGGGTASAGGSGAS